jgi:hypothetical protein
MATADDDSFARIAFQRLASTRLPRSRAWVRLEVDTATRLPLALAERDCERSRQRAAEVRRRDYIANKVAVLRARAATEAGGGAYAAARRAALSLRSRAHAVQTIMHFAAVHASAAATALSADAGAMTASLAAVGGAGGASG